eukprot:TRINITY_DN5083_c0_g3_i6.p1 TRINITY_DN5083_c0_g3~~TRINITY_DN5083_c0_g3_i6.p1  ORF type:complete len:175 (+),score=25.57 TRINITY_DN5083_c0_g3_i6:177-701(+)
MSHSRPGVPAVEGLSFPFNAQVEVRVMSRIKSEVYRERLKFRRDAWRLYRKAWKRKLGVLCERRLEALKRRGAVRIYKKWKIYKNVSKYRRIKRQICKVQAHWRGYKIRCSYVHQKKMITKIQAQIRRYLGMKKFIAVKSLVLRIQAMSKLFLVKHHKKLDKLARKIQKFMKTM